MSKNEFNVRHFKIIKKIATTKSHDHERGDPKNKQTQNGDFVVGLRFLGIFRVGPPPPPSSFDKIESVSIHNVICKGFCT